MPDHTHSKLPIKCIASIKVNLLRFRLMYHLTYCLTYQSFHIPLVQVYLTNKLSDKKIHMLDKGSMLLDIQTAPLKRFFFKIPCMTELLLLLLLSLLLLLV